MNAAMKYPKPNSCIPKGQATAELALPLVDDFSFYFSDAASSVLTTTIPHLFPSPAFLVKSPHHSGLNLRITSSGRLPPPQTPLCMVI